MGRPDRMMDDSMRLLGQTLHAALAALLGVRAAVAQFPRSHLHIHSVTPGRLRLFRADRDDHAGECGRHRRSPPYHRARRGRSGGHRRQHRDRQGIARRAPPTDGSDTSSTPTNTRITSSGTPRWRSSPTWHDFLRRASCVGTASAGRRGSRRQRTGIVISRRSQRMHAS